MLLGITLATMVDLSLNLRVLFNFFTAEKTEHHPAAKGIDRHESPQLWGLIEDLCLLLNHFASMFIWWLGNLTLNLRWFWKHNLHPLPVNELLCWLQKKSPEKLTIGLCEWTEWSGEFLWLWVSKCQFKWLLVLIKTFVLSIYFHRNSVQKNLVYYIEGY